MKRFLSLLSIVIILIILILTLGAKTEYAASETNVGWISNKSQVIPGQTFTVTLSANCDDGINGINTTLNYDSNVLEVVEEGVVDTSKWIWAGEGNEISVIAVNPTIQSSDIYRITFKVKENAPTGKSTTININNTFLSVFGTDKTFGTKSVSIAIISKQLTSIKMKTNPTVLKYKQKYGTLNLAGGILTATYNDGSTKEVSLTSSDVQVTGFSNTTPGEQTLTVKYGGKTTTFKVNVLRLGDTNSDNKIDILDIFAVNKHRLNKQTLQGDNLIVADVNNDGKVDILDIFQLNKFRLGKITSL